MNNANYEGNPLYQRAKQMVEGKNPAQMEDIARNICKEKGINYEEAFAAFQRQMKGS